MPVWSCLGFGLVMHPRGAKPLTELPREGLSFFRRSLVVPTGHIPVRSSRLVVSVNPILVRGSLSDGLGLVSVSLRRDQGIKGHREKDGSGGISGLQLPPAPVRDLRNALLDHHRDRFACKCVRLLHVGHLETFVVDDGVM